MERTSRRQLKDKIFLLALCKHWKDVVNRNAENPPIQALLIYSNVFGML
jgi:hypothetical protein